MLCVEPTSTPHAAAPPCASLAQERSHAKAESHERVIGVIATGGENAVLSGAAAMRRAARAHHHVIVYGGSLDALQAIGALQEAGVPGRLIEWVYDELPPEMCANSAMARAMWPMVQQRMRDSGITLASGLRLQRVKSMSGENDSRHLCAAVFCGPCV